MLPLFGKGTKREEGRKDDPLPPLSLPVQPDLRGKRIEKHHSIEENPSDKGYYICYTGEDEGVLPFPYKWGLKQPELPRVRVGQ